MSQSTRLSRRTILAALEGYTAECTGCDFPMDGPQFLAEYAYTGVDVLPGNVVRHIPPSSSQLPPPGELMVQPGLAMGSTAFTAQKPAPVPPPLSRLETLQAKSQEIQGKIQEIQAQITPLGDVEKAIVGGLELRLDDIRKTYETVAAHKEVQTQIATGEKAFAKIEESEVSFKSDIEKLKRIQSLMIGSAVSEFEGAANKLAVAGLKFEVDVERQTFGLRAPNGFHAWRSLSGGEAILCKAAFMSGIYGMYGESLPYRPLFIDEFQSVGGHEEQIELLRCIAALYKAGIITQALVSGNHWIESKLNPDQLEMYVLAAREKAGKLGFKIVDLSGVAEPTPVDDDDIPF